MASFKEFGSKDIANTKTLFHEAIPITGSIISGTYSESNIKNFTHGMFQSVFDYPYLSSSANQLFDMTVGYSVDSPMSASAVVASNTTISKKKINIYNQMSKVLAGVDTDGSILYLDEDGNFNNSGDLIKNSFFINFSRLLAKDEIKKGSFSLILGVGTSSSEPFAATLTITDASGSDSYGINSPVGEYGILYAKDLVNAAGSATGSLNVSSSCGMIFYQAGVIALNTNIFALSSSNSVNANIASNQRGLLNFSSAPILSSSLNVAQLLASGSIDSFNYGIRNRIKQLTINNTTELNSSIYFCKIDTDEFNYSSNPTYLSNSKIIVKADRIDRQPISYFTTVGLYSKNNELLAVAKVSEPIKKTPEVSLTLRVRLDF